MATASPIGAHGIEEEGEVNVEPEEEEEEEIETPQRQSNKHKGWTVEDGENEDENNLEYQDYNPNNPRKRRQTAVQRNLRAQKHMLRDAVQKAKQSGGATEYHGLLGRNTIVGWGKKLRVENMGLL